MAEPSIKVVEQHDKVLQDAWKRVIDIGEVASNLKIGYERLKLLTSNLSFYILVCVALLSVLSFENALSFWWLVPGFMLVIVYFYFSKCPVIWKRTFIGLTLSIGIYTYIRPELVAVELMLWLIIIYFTILNILALWRARAAIGVLWIDYRVQAEELRSHIYVYRVKLWYSSEDKGDLQTYLKDQIKYASDKISKIQGHVPFIGGRYDEDRIYDSDPLAPISITQYIQSRAEDQRRWYAEKIGRDLNSAARWYVDNIERDYTIMSKVFVASQIIVFVVIVLAGLDMLMLVCAILALIIWFALPSTMGREIYDVFHSTAVKIEDAITGWHLEHEEENDIDTILKFVDSLETILRDERVLWQRIAKAETAKIVAWTSDIQDTVSNDLYQSSATTTTKPLSVNAGNTSSQSVLPDKTTTISKA